MYRPQFTNDEVDLKRSSAAISSCVYRSKCKSVYVPAVVENPFLSIVHEVRPLAVAVPKTRELCGHAPGEHSALHFGMLRLPLKTSNH